METVPFRYNKTEKTKDDVADVDKYQRLQFSMINILDSKYKKASLDEMHEGNYKTEVHFFLDVTFPKSWLFHFSGFDFKVRCNAIKRSHKSF